MEESEDSASGDGLAAHEQQLRTSEVGRRVDDEALT